MRALLFFLVLLIPWSLYATTSRTIDADALRSSNGTKTWTLPTVGGTLSSSGSVLQEIPSGTVNGSNTTFTLANTPLSNAVVQVHLDGILMEQGAGKDYTISGSTITMLTAPVAGQSLLVIYAR